MQVSVVNTGALERRVEVQVPEDRIASQVQERLKKLARSTRIAGFRPGRAPLKVVEQRFGGQVREEVVGEVLQTSFREAVLKENLRPAGDPTIGPFEARPGEGLSYTATFEVFPEIKLDRITDLPVDKPVCEATAADVDRVIESLRAQNPIWDAVERPAAAGDRVVISYRGLVDGAEFEGGSREHVPVELGAGGLLAGFEEGLIGASAGEQRTLNLRFPDEFGRAQLAGRDVIFEVQIESVLQRRLPELDEGFFEKFGVEQGGLEAFRAEVRRNMEREMAQALRLRLRQNLMQALYDANPVEVPRALLASEGQRLYQDLRRRFEQQGMPPAQLEGFSPEVVQDEARRRVTLGLIVAEIVRANALQADPGRVRERVEAAAASYEDPGAVVKWYYEDRRRLAEVESAVLEDAALDWLLERAKVTERALSFDALMNPGQTDAGTQEDRPDDR